MNTLLLLLCLQAVRVQPAIHQPLPVPITVHNDRQQIFDVGEMQRLYEESTAAVELELNGNHPVPVRPPIDLYLGADTDDTLFQDDPPIQRIELQKWNPELFALGVVIIARDSSISIEKARHLAHHAFVAAEARTDLKEKQ